MPEQENGDILNFSISQVVGRARAEVTGGAWTRRGSGSVHEGYARMCGQNCQAYLPIDVFAVFDREHVQPIGTDTAVENTIRPDPIGPDLLLLKMTFQRLAVEGVFGEVTEGFFDPFSCGIITILEVFERLRCEADLPHCSSPNAALKE